ncbi:Uncharacterised protein [Vibrio cholerae]|nr:Uncharacterised protein [Vibrio cholerae]
MPNESKTKINALFIAHSPELTRLVLEFDGKHPVLVGNHRPL